MPKKRVWKAKLTDGLHPIMIDLEVHKAIESARETFTEMPNAILRRLLSLDSPRPAAAPVPPAATERKNPEARMRRAVNGRRHELSLPEGTELRAVYCGMTVTGEIHAGAWDVEGTRFNLPSNTLIASLRDHADELEETKGWRQWEVRLPGAERWEPLTEPS